MTALNTKFMIKRLVLLCILGSFLIVSSWSLAQETEEAPLPSASSAVDEKKVQALKEKLATKVAELRENQKRGFFGMIAALDKTSFTLVTPSGEVQVKFNEDTLFYRFGRTRTEAAMKDLSNSAYAAVLGHYDEQSKQHAAKAIVLQSQISFVTGEVTVIDKSKGTLTVKMADDKEMSVEYEKTTVAEEVNANKNIARSGLSRFVVGDKVHIWGAINEEDASNISANRILRVSQELIAPEEVIEEAVIESTPSPSPRVRTSPRVSPRPRPSATPRATPRARVTPTPEASAEE